MKSGIAAAALCLLLVVGSQAEPNRKLLQRVYAGSPSTLTVSASNPNVNAITITLAIPYPQAAYYCNVTGDSRIPQQGPFPLTVRVPVGVTSTVIFANITGPIPGTSCSTVQQPGATVVQQSSSVQQIVNNPSSVVQQTGAGASVVQQQYASSVNQQNSNPGAYFNCIGNGTTVVQQQGGSTSVVQQPGGTSVVQQPQGPPSTVVQQPQGPPSTVVQQPQGPPSSVVQQPQGPPSSVVQQGRKLLQVGTIEYISNNGSTGQPQLSVLDTVEGVPNISFKPTAAGQVAQFNGALQVAVTTTNDGFGTPYIPYRVDSRLSPQCQVQVNFVSF